MSTPQDADLSVRPMLGELLVKQGKLSARDLDQALGAQKEMGDLLGRVLVKLGVLSELDVARALSEQLAIEFVQSEGFNAEIAVPPTLAHDFLQGNHILPIGLDDQSIRVVMAVPQDAFLVKAIHLATGLRVEPRLGLESEIQLGLNALLTHDDVDDERSVLGGEAVDAAEFIEHLRDLASEAPVIRHVNQIIARALDLRASDIHIEPFEGGLNVRYRIDGVLQPLEHFSAELAAAITSRVKLLAHLNIAERRLPQDGRIKFRAKGHELDLRVSTVPTVYGESVVLRVLDRDSVRLDLDTMGFSPDVLDRFSEQLERPHGILLVTGPTGSGKTTTLYASLSKLDSATLKILTVEDPVEYQLEGINQIQVHQQIDLTFANALRSILRQDPDIIMIGEMRDGETAQIAVQSALTGHLVLSTLHTNTAAAAVIRMRDMGVESYLITSTVNAVLAQRLVRRLCPHCREPIELPDAALASTGVGKFMAPGQRTVYKARGCPQCKQTGYLGRTPIHEFFVMNGELQQLILDGADAMALHAAARREGMYTLYEDGLRKVVLGVTSIEELMRVTQDYADA